MSSHIPGYEYQLAHIHDDKGPRTIAASGVLIAATTLAIVLRLLAQRMVKSALTLDDYCAIAAWASGCPYKPLAFSSLILDIVGSCCRTLWRLDCLYKPIARI